MGKAIGTKQCGQLLRGHSGTLLSWETQQGLNGRVATLLG